MSRYVDAEWLIKESMPLSFSVQKWVNEVQIMTAPSIDIVFCKECKHRINDDDFQEGHICLKRRANGGKYCRDNDFYSYGERREP